MTPVRGNPQMSCLTSAHSRLTPLPTAHRSAHFTHQPLILLPLAFLNSLSFYSNSVWHDTVFTLSNDFSVYMQIFSQTASGKMTRTESMKDLFLQSYSQINTDLFVIISEMINYFYTVILVESHRVRFRLIQAK